jgi:O-antigen/teichoic acid export membrane protein
MTLVGRNIMANVAGTGLGIVVFLVVVPVYLRLLGAEVYGLVGLLTTLMVAAAALDLGLGATMSRETARMTVRATASPGFAHVVVTLQVACWAIAIGFGVLFIAMAPAITRWLTFSTLSHAEVRGALGLLGATLPALVLRGFYLTALNGLQRQSLTNVVQVGGAVVRGTVTIAALGLVASTSTVFFVTHLVLFYVEVGVLVALLRRSLPGGAQGGRIRLAAIRPLLGFSLGMAGTLLLGLALTSMDQIVLSAVLPLAEFGYYTLAVTAATAIGQVVRPVTTAVYPRFSQLFERGDIDGAAEEYHFFSQLVGTVVLPLGVLLVCFSGDVLTVWTGNAELVRHAAVVLSLRTLGTMLNAVMHVPHVVQLAFGWSTLGARVNAVAVLVMAPVIIVLSQWWGGPGAALAWVLLNVGILLVAMGRMHRRVLPGELARWYGGLLMQATAVATVGVLARAAMPETLGTIARLTWLATTGGLAAAAALGISSTVRRRVVAAARAA